MDSTSRIHRPFYRNGVSHRDGADVSFGDVVKVFGFKSVQIGKWVNKEEQQIAANLFFDALCDLMDILQVPEHVISLNSNLALAFGVGGQKHSSAHYDSRKGQLALAKNAGGGALAHEWFHAFDHYICSRVFTKPRPNSFASQCWLNDQPQIAHALNKQLGSWFAKVFLSEDGTEPSDYVSRCAIADKTLKMYYYSQPQELTARAFEAAIQDHPIKNAFLVQGTKLSDEAKVGIYPSDGHRQECASAVLCYFNSLGIALSR